MSSRWLIEITSKADKSLEIEIDTEGIFEIVGKDRAVSSLELNQLYEIAKVIDINSYTKMECTKLSD